MYLPNNNEHTTVTVIKIIYSVFFLITYDSFMNIQLRPPPPLSLGTCGSYPVSSRLLTITLSHYTAHVSFRFQELRITTSVLHRSSSS